MKLHWNPKQTTHVPPPPPPPHTHTHVFTSILVRALIGIIHSLAPYPNLNHPWGCRGWMMGVPVHDCHTRDQGTVSGFGIIVLWLRFMKKGVSEVTENVFFTKPDQDLSLTSVMIQELCECEQNHETL